ncbi:AAA family ATPase [Solirubrobacter phytolaccae]|uniref:AAA family ATPase n=1 Tax=Solirubrobacter phytolaccae TaxID=1404360 RepID=A0A9X3NES0_9ACTN|nr:AAA family ATPase [Solirubrobacter phytolaccae]MDA0180477.1 AAA family ATPase [Solirubrobacter phytolaccae]
MANDVNRPLVGRDAELERIAALHARRAPGVVIVGPAGVGKSRLAREAVAAAADTGALAPWVQATRSAATVPLAACAGLLPADARSEDPVELMRLCAEALRERADGRPIVLGVDDAQRLDPTSATLVLHLVSSGLVFLVATVRVGEPCPDAVRALMDDAGAEPLELRELSERDAAALVEALLDGPVEQRVQRWAYERTRGNVLYLRELVTGAIAGGAFEDAGGLWRLTRQPPPSASLSDLIGDRLAELEPAERHVIELLALGEPLRRTEIVTLAGASAADRVAARGFVRIADADVRLEHPLYGDVVRASLSSVRAMDARVRLAATVRARPDRSSADALLVARWLLDADQPVAPALALEAAQAALEAGDPDLCARLVQDVDGVEATLLLARAHSVRQRHEEAEVVLAALEGTITSQLLALRYLQQRAVGLLWGLRQAEAGAELLLRAREWWPDDPAWRSQIAPLRVRLVAATTGYRAAIESSSQALADPSLEGAARRRMELVHATNCFYGGRVQEAHERIGALRPALPLRDEIDEAAMIMSCVIGLESGWGLDTTANFMAQALAASIRADEHAGAGIAAVALGAIALLAGRYHEADRWLAEAVVHLERQDPFGSLASAHALRVGVGFFTGDDERVESSLSACRATMKLEPLDTDLVYTVRGEAWAELAAGDAAAAQARLLAEAERTSLPVYAAQLYYEALRAGAPAARVVEPLRAVCAECDGRFAAAYLAHAEAADGPALSACADELVAIGAARYAAECAARAAEAFTATGREDDARRAAARVAQLHDAEQGGFAPVIRANPPRR